MASVAEAKTKAEKYLRLHNKYAKTSYLLPPGNPDIVAGVTAAHRLGAGREIHSRAGCAFGRPVRLHHAGQAFAQDIEDTMDEQQNILSEARSDGTVTAIDSVKRKARGNLGTQASFRLGRRTPALRSEFLHKPDAKHTHEITDTSRRRHSQRIP